MDLASQPETESMLVVFILLDCLQYAVLLVIEILTHCSRSDRDRVGSSSCHVQPEMDQDLLSDSDSMSMALLPGLHDLCFNALENPLALDANVDHPCLQCTGESPSESHKSNETELPTSLGVDDILDPNLASYQPGSCPGAVTYVQLESIYPGAPEHSDCETAIQDSNVQSGQPNIRPPIRGDELDGSVRIVSGSPRADSCDSKNSSAQALQSQGASPCSSLKHISESSKHESPQKRIGESQLQPDLKLIEALSSESGPVTGPFPESAMQQRSTKDLNSESLSRIDGTKQRDYESESNLLIHDEAESTVKVPTQKELKTLLDSESLLSPTDSDLYDSYSSSTIKNSDSEYDSIHPNWSCEAGSLKQESIDKNITGDSESNSTLVEPMSSATQNEQHCNVSESGTTQSLPVDQESLPRTTKTDERDSTPKVSTHKECKADYWDSNSGPKLPLPEPVSVLNKIDEEYKSVFQSLSKEPFSILKFEPETEMLTRYGLKDSQTAEKINASDAYYFKFTPELEEMENQTTFGPGVSESISETLNRLEPLLAALRNDALAMDQPKMDRPDMDHDLPLCSDLKQTGSSICELSELDEVKPSVSLKWNQDSVDSGQGLEDRHDHKEVTKNKTAQSNVEIDDSNVPRLKPFTVTEVYAFISESENDENQDKKQPESTVTKL